MDSFRELMNIANEQEEKIKDFLQKRPNWSKKELQKEIHASTMYSQQIRERLEKIPRRMEGSGYGYDMCIYAMNCHLALMYEHAVLISYVKKLEKIDEYVPKIPK